MNEIYLALIGLAGGSILTPLIQWLMSNAKNKKEEAQEDKRDWRQLYIEKEKENEYKDTLILDLSTKLSATTAEIRFLKEKYGA